VLGCFPGNHATKNNLLVVLVGAFFSAGVFFVLVFWVASVLNISFNARDENTVFIVSWMIGGLLGLAGRAIPAFVRHQYAYVGPDSRSHLLVMNLSNVTNRVRVVASREGRVLGARLLRLPPMGSTLLDIGTFGSAPDSSAPGSAGTEVWRLRLEGAAWFNLYIVGAGARNLEGPLSLMHVK